MVTMRRLAASFGAAMALGLAMTGVTLAADPSEVDLSGTVEGNGQAQIDLDLLDERADAEADADAAAIVDADVALDPDADVDADVAADARVALNGRGNARRAERAVADAAANADVATDVDGATAVDDTSVTGFMALDVCTRLALLDKTGPCHVAASGGPSGGNAVVDGHASLADSALDAALSEDGSIGPDDGNLAAAAASDSCVRFAVLDDAAACAAEARSDDGSSTADDNAVESPAKLATGADAAATEEGTTGTAALDSCASVAINADASACAMASEPGGGDGSGTAPGAITRPDAAADGEGPGGSLPDTASMLFGNPFGPLAVLLALLAGSTALRRVRIAMR